MDLKKLPPIYAVVFPGTTGIVHLREELSEAQSLTDEGEGTRTLVEYVPRRVLVKRAAAH